MATIQGVYLALFARPADPSGLAFFNTVTNNGANLAGIGDLASQAEYVTRFAGQSTTQIVQSIYQSLFGRLGETDGVNFFVAQLASGAQTINTIAINILDGAQGTDLQIVNNKLAASQLFTNALDTPAEQAAYSGTAAADVGRNFLSPITADPSTVPTASQADAAVLLLGGGSLTTALTPGTDLLTGTAGANLYTATDQTLNSSDVIDGAGGDDKLTLTLSGTSGSTDTSPTLKNVETIEILGTGGYTLNFTNITGATKLILNNTGNVATNNSPSGLVYEIGTQKTGNLDLGLGATTLNINLAGEAGKGAGVSQIYYFTLGAQAGTMEVTSSGTGAINQLGLITGNATKINISSETGQTSRVSLSVENVGMIVDASKMESAGILFTGSGGADTVIGGKGANVFETNAGQDDITITASTGVSDKVSFEGVKTSADYNIVRGFEAGGGGDVIGILASDTSATTSDSNPPVFQTVASQATFTRFDTTINDVLELSYQANFTGGSAVDNLIKAVGGEAGGIGFPPGVLGTSGGSGYIVAYSTAGEALLFYAADTATSTTAVFDASEIQFVGNITGISVGSMTTSNFDLVP